MRMPKANYVCRGRVLGRIPSLIILSHFTRVGTLQRIETYLARKEAVSRRHNKERHESRKRKATGNGDTHRDTARGARENQGHGAQYRGKARHQNWAEAAFRRHPSRLKLATAGTRRNLVRKFHNQNTVLRHKCDQENQSNLAKDVECLARNEQARKRTRQGKRHRKEDDERSAETFKLPRKHQEHQRKRQEEHESHYECHDHAHMLNFDRPDDSDLEYREQVGKRVDSLIRYYAAHPQKGEHNHRRTCKILRLYRQGLTEREISNKLKISHQTVHQYIEYAFRRLKYCQKKTTI